MTGTILAAGAWALVVAVGGGLLTRIGPWYWALRKPAWQPPDYLFGPVWTAIFAAAAAAFVLGWRHAPDPAARSWLAVLFVVNGALNIGWSLLFFTWRRPDWALIEVAGLWLSILAPLVFLAPFAPLAAWLLVPYLLWVSFAAVLNREIVRRNAPFTAAVQRA